MSLHATPAPPTSPSATTPGDAEPDGSRYAAPRRKIDPDRDKSWLARALPLVAAHRAVFGTSIAASFAGLVLQVLIPNLLKDAIDNSILTSRVPLGHYVWWILALALATGVAGYAARTAMYRTAYDIEFDLRNLLYEHLTTLSFSFYDRVQSGQLISRANSDIRSVQMYLTFGPLILVQCSIVVVAFAFMVSISWPLALASMAVTPFVYLAGRKMREAMFPVSWVIQARLAEVATVVDESIGGVRVVKAFAAEGTQLRHLARAARRLRWAYVKDADLRAGFTPQVQNLPQVALVIVLLLGGAMVVAGHLQVGAILAFNLYLFMVQAPFMMLGMLVMLGQRAAASAQRIYEILDETPNVVEAADATALESPTGDVAFDQVRFAYPQRPGHRVLDGLELHLSPGETVALVGRTGSGKSTVARLLARFYDVEQGAVRLDGRDVRDLTLHCVREAVGIVLEEPFLFSSSIRDNIAFGVPRASDAAVERAARDAGAHGFICALPDAYDTVVGERGYTLSGGQRQRIAIARTLLADPAVLVLDDATSAVDVEVERAIHAALERREGTRTTLVIAHRLSSIAMADRVLLLDGGRLAASGTHEELLERTPLYAEVLAQVGEATPAPSAAPAGGGT